MICSAKRGHSLFQYVRVCKERGTLNQKSKCAFRFLPGLVSRHWTCSQWLIVREWDDSVKKPPPSVQKKSSACRHWKCKRPQIWTAQRGAKDGTWHARLTRCFSSVSSSSGNVDTICPLVGGINRKRWKINSQASVPALVPLSVERRTPLPVPAKRYVPPDPHWG